MPSRYVVQVFSGDERHGLFEIVAVNGFARDATAVTVVGSSIAQNGNNAFFCQDVVGCVVVVAPGVGKVGGIVRVGG